MVGILYRRPHLRMMSVGLFAVLAGGPALAADAHLFPQTKLRISVVQWSPGKGIYEDWPALSGEFVIADGGTLTLPVVGQLPVGDLDEQAVAKSYAKQLQTKTGLLQAPEVTVAVTEYPPVYVLGDVETPGEYKYRPGLTALQALALGGGTAKATTEEADTSVKLLFDLRSATDEIVKNQARIDRLAAEMSGDQSVKIPDDVAANPIAVETYRRENLILAARTKELERQTATLNELRKLLEAEISSLDQKAASMDESIQMTEKELNAVNELVQKGVVVVSRQTDLKRVLSGLRSDRLDQVTSVMRARQNIAEATRNIDGLRDKRQTEVALELQSEEAGLQQAKLKRDLATKLLLRSADAETDSSPGTTVSTVLAYTIVRQLNGLAVEQPASDTMQLLPGDVLTVKRNAPVESERSSSAPSPATSQTVSQASR